jgi:hypothetical protein
MCQKSCQVFKQFYAVILTNPLSTPKALQVFRHQPTAQQVDYAVSKNIMEKVKPVPHLYSEKPKIDVIPIHIPVGILYH